MFKLGDPVRTAILLNYDDDTRCPYWGYQWCRALADDGYVVAIVDHGDVIFRTHAFICDGDNPIPSLDGLNNWKVEDRERIAEMMNDDLLRYRPWPKSTRK